MEYLIKIATRLGIPASVMMAARNDAKGQAHLEAEVERRLERVLLDQEDSGRTAKAILEALGVADEKSAVARTVELLKSEAKLKEVEPQVEAFKKAQAEAEARQVEADVDEAIKTHRLPATVRAALLHQRRTAAAEFAKDYPKPPPGFAHIVQTLSTERRTEDAAPRTLEALAAYPGRNDLERAMAMVEAKAGRALPFDQKHEAGTRLLTELRGAR